MTYRRLSRYLLIGSTLFSAVVWWMSLRPDASFNAFVPGHHFHLRFHRGAVLLVTHEGPYPKYDAQFFEVPAISMVFVRDFPHGPWGALRMGSSDAFPSASGHTFHYHYVVVPIWLAYGLVAGGGVALLRWAERRRKDAGEMRGVR